MSHSAVEEYISKLVTGVFLIMLYFLSIWLVIGALSSYQFQQNVKRDIKTDLQPSQAIFYAIESAAIESQIKDLKDSITEDHVTNENKRIELANLSNQRDLLEVEMAHSENDNDKLELEKRIAEQNDDITVLENGIRGLGQTIKDQNETLTTKKAKHENYKTRTIDIERHLVDYEFMRRFLFSWLAQMPSQILVLALTLSMGLLGSLLYLTREYFGYQEKRSFIFYLFRLMFGMVVALAVYILAIGGQLAVTSSLTKGQMGSLNPYIISFLGIVSGLMSEQAYEKIKFAGVKLFQTSEETKRWGIHLKSEINKQKKKSEQLIRYNIGNEEFQRWANEDEAVPERAQLILAAWLNKPVREIFSDIKEDLSKT